MRIGTWLCSALTVLAFGCVFGKTTFNSKRTWRLRHPDSCLRDVTGQDTGFNNKVYKGLDKEIREGFGNSGVQARWCTSMNMDLDPEQRFAEALERFHPDAVLVVRGRVET
jgi:hypothetical protein